MAHTTRVSVPLASSEVQALVAMAHDECRHPREQLRHLLREAARARGLALVDQPDPTPPAPSAQQRAA